MTEPSGAATHDLGPAKRKQTPEEIVRRLQAPRVRPSALDPLRGAHSPA
jgi:hypothetical protein